MTTRFTSCLALLMLACGPQATDDHAEDAAGPGAAADDCGDASCSPAPCGERRLNCAGGLGMGECVDGKCAPVPMTCIIESDAEATCTEACARKGEDVVCVENGCEGATAFGYPGVELQALEVCGHAAPDVLEAVVPIQAPCDAPLVFRGEGSFAVYQCCCDHPEY